MQFFKNILGMFFVIIYFIMKKVELKDKYKYIMGS